MRSPSQNRKPALESLGLTFVVALSFGLSSAPALSQTEPQPEVVEMDGDWDEDEVPDEDNTDEDNNWDDDDDDAFVAEELSTTILGNTADRKRIAGSAHQIGEEELERDEHNSVHEVLKKVPGVYLRDEEGFGLRPNIGLRGANSDRSAKVTLMEDGVLLGPAPYSAPAAYFFPLVTRMTRFEVFKGPASIKFGPQTVGGAVNMQSRQIPFDGHRAGLDLAGGSFLGAKAHAHYGFGEKYFGGLVEGVYLTNDGFKKRDDGGPTGFQRADLLAKFRVNTALDAAWVHRADVQLGYAYEDGYETYLGLSDDDFKRDAYRRYDATNRSKVDWSRTQFQGRYAVSYKNQTTFRATAYRHDMGRDWEKLNRFQGGPALAEILRDPTRAEHRRFFNVLKGAQDSDDDAETLLIGNNARTYVSQGLQLNLSSEFSFLDTEHEIEVGARIHNDSVERRHDEEGYRMTDHELIADGNGRELVLSNRGETWAGAAFVHYAFRWNRLLITPGFRAELIRTSLINHETGIEQDALRLAWLPGIGASYTLFDRATLFAGVHKGFSPVSPGQAAEVMPEESINAEMGTRYAHKKLHVEAIGFVNRYANITGECTFSSGCDPELLTTQFNGGEAWVYGGEFQAGYTTKLPFGLRAGADAAYTLSLSRFGTGFASQFDQFGVVSVGDELPYVPMHQFAGHFRVGGPNWEGAMDVSYISAMRDRAGQGPLDPTLSTEQQLVLDAGASYNIIDQVRLYVRAENLLGQRAIASRRPFGARPNKPRSIMVGLKVDIGR